MIYFITCDSPDYPIKIGYTRGEAKFDVLPQARRWNPVKMIVLATCQGGTLHERLWHRVFAKDRLESEWFRRTDLLMKAIKESEGKAYYDPSNITAS